MDSLGITMDAISNLSEADKNRLIVTYLHHNDRNNVNWSEAATFTGSKTANSLRVNVGKVLKKMKDASAAVAGNGGAPQKRKKGDADEDEGVTGADGEAVADAGAPKKHAKKKQGGKKKKAVSDAEEGSEGKD